MGVALYFLIWGIWTESGKFTVTLKYLIQISSTRARWMQNHERIAVIFK